jgi:adenylate cyclase
MARLRSRMEHGGVPPELLHDLRAVLRHAAVVGEQVEELDLLHAITVEASTYLENELSVRNDLVTGFLASTSHEIRTPLNGIIGQAELLMEELAEEGRSRACEDLGKIVVAGRHLVALVNDILDLSKVESGRMQLSTEPVDLLGVVHDALEGCAPIARRNHVTFVTELQPGICLDSDPLRIRQCLLNLVGNACKFTRGGEVLIRAWTDRDERGEQVFVAVRDEGIGIAAEHLANVFEPYRQAAASTGRDYGGTGLGLAYTRSLARRMGGDVKVVSEPGLGSTFTLRLPARPVGVP